MAVHSAQKMRRIVAEVAEMDRKFAPLIARRPLCTIGRSAPTESHFESLVSSVISQQLAEIPVGEFIALNPAYSRPVMPTASNSPLVLPAEKVQTFLDNLQSHEAQDKPLSAWHTHNLKKGEKLDSVALRYGISAARLKQLNGINARTKIAPGFALLVPGKDAIGHEAIAAQLPQTPTKPPRATKWKKGKAKGKATGVNAKIRKSPPPKQAVKPKKR